jgi:thiol:disulfide interchange protein DsbD
MNMIKKSWLSILAVLWLICGSLQADAGEGVRVRLVTDAPIPAQGGKPFAATVILDLDPGWHTYWQYPGDSGLPPKVTWQLPEGWTAGSLEFSIPQEFSEPGEMIVYGYEKQQLLRATITPPRDLPKDKTFDLKASLTWLACKELCVPGSAEVELKVLGPTDGEVDWKSASVPKGDWPLPSKPPFPVTWSANTSNVAISFLGKTNASYTFYPDPQEGGQVGHVTRIASPANGAQAVVFSIPLQGAVLSQGLLVEQISGDKKAWWIHKNTSQAIIQKDQTKSGYALFIALCSGFLGGLILNLMPCVLPVISLKIFGFISQAGTSPQRILRHGLAFTAGVFSWFLGLGGLVILLKSGGHQVTWGAFQFQSPLFVVLLSLLVFVFALNLLGLFEITLPGAASTRLDKAASSEGYLGSFFQGLFATLLATPCTAPFLGSALGFAFGQSPVVILAMFLAVATGMSFPYLLLSAKPGWRTWIPKPGTWMEIVRQFLAFPLLATNVWLLWVVNNQLGGAAVLTILTLFLLIALLLWGIVRSGVITRGFLRIPLRIVVILLLGFPSLFLIRSVLQLSPATAKTSGTESTTEGIAWIPYSAAELERLRSEGKPVFLDFTASWCLTCQFNDRTSINVPAVRKILRDKGITAMKGDWTNSDPAITEALKSFGRVGVPLAVYYPAGKGSAPIVLPELLTEKIVLEALGN